MGMIPDAHDKNTPKKRKKLEPGGHYARVFQVVGRGGEIVNKKSPAFNAGLF
jgi:hypothetical protein